MRTALVAVLVAIPWLAAANPVTVGFSVGATVTKSDAAAGADSNDTLGLFGRLGFNQWFSGQLEIEKIQNDASTNVRAINFAGVLDLMQHSSVVPMVVAGVGFDHASSDFQDISAHHFEAGLGVELRTSGGFTLGLDVRIGDREIDDTSSKGVPVGVSGGSGLDRTAPLPPASDIKDGQYRSARITLGIRF